jgi:hypothetical protein
MGEGAAATDGDAADTGRVRPHGQRRGRGARADGPAEADDASAGAPTAGGGERRRVPVEGEARRGRRGRPWGRADEAQQRSRRNRGGQRKAA